MDITNIGINAGLGAWENSHPSIELDGEGEVRKWLPKSMEQFQLLFHVAIGKQRKYLFLWVTNTINKSYVWCLC
jgi:hypothetical protein